MCAMYLQNNAFTYSKQMIVLFFFIFDVILGNNENFFKRFEYQHSFRAPNLAQRDGSIPFWKVYNDAIASDEQLRLAPSMRSRKGLAWNEEPFVVSSDFQVEIAFKISGQTRIGADGLAIWYTASQGVVGPVFGANDYWVGMALILDSFDNDNKKNNPYVSLMINDGRQSYDHQSDGANQIVAGCQKDFRNKPFPVRLRIEYAKNILTVSISDGMSPEPRYELCLRSENIFLPKNGFFGVSAATGGLADDHDILEFSVFSLLNKFQQTSIPLDQRQKYDAEFIKQMQEYEKERKEFKKQHPDKAKDDEEDFAKYHEDATAREMRLIHETQATIYQILQTIDTKFNDQIALLQQGCSARQSVHQTSGNIQQQKLDGVFQPHEKNEVLQLLRDLTSSSRDLKNYVNEIYSRTYKIEQSINVNNGGSADVSEIQKKIYNNLDHIQNEIRQIRTYQTQIPQSIKNENSISCASSMFLTVLVIMQSIVILAFIFIRSKPEKTKFY